jgi:hypothetical protein
MTSPCLTILVVAALSLVACGKPAAQLPAVPPSVEYLTVEDRLVMLTNQLPGRRADVEVYLRRASGLDLSDDHFTRAQRPATIITRRAQLRMFATAIVKSGIAADTLVESPDNPDGPRGHQHDDCPLCRGRERHDGAALCSNHSSDSRAAVTRKSTSVARTANSPASWRLV